MKHLKYLRYLIRHKWFVLVAGLRIGAPLWRLITHDLDKFLPSEWFAYVEYFYGGKGWNQPAKDRFDVAWLRHQHRNDHHHQFWVLREDSGGIKHIDMPRSAIMEMIADWAGAGRAITGQWEVADWFDRNVVNMRMTHETELTARAIINVNFRKAAQP